MSAMLFPACGSSDGGPEFVSGPTAWEVADIVGKKKVRIVAQAGACEGVSEPRISEVTTVYEGKRVYITAELFVPPKLEEAQQTACAGTGLFVYRTVQLNREMGDSLLLDASQEPPELRWPVRGDE